MLLNRQDIVQCVNYSRVYAQFATWEEFISMIAIIAFQITEKSFPNMLDHSDRDVYEHLAKQKLDIKIPNIPLSFESYVEFFQKPKNQKSYYVAYNATKYVIRFLSHNGLKVEDFIPSHLSIGKLC